VGATRRLLQAGAAPGSDARARAELAELARRHPAVAELSLPLLTGSTGAVAPLIGGVRLGALAQLRPRVVRRTPLAHAHEDAGANLAPAGRGWIDVVDHGDPEAERRALRIGAAVIDSGRCGLFRLDGASAPRLLAAALSRPVVLEVGSVAAVTAPELGAAVLVARVGELTWLARTEPGDTDAFDERLVAEAAGDRRAAVHVAVLTEGLAGILFAGPRAESCATELLGQPPGVDRVVVFDAEAGAEAGFAWCVEQDGHPVYELRVPAGRAVAVWRASVAAARAHQGRPVGVVAWSEHRSSRVIDEVAHV
jgi:glycine cleavage system aminomethyltransferase T